MNLKERLAGKKPIFGSWLTLPDSSIAEIMAASGFDFLVVDMEHSAIEIGETQRLIQAIQSKGISPLVRLGENNPNLVKRVMDAGAHGVIMAQVTTPGDARRVIEAVKYPPAGKRGVGLARAQEYGFGFEKYKKWLEKESIVIAIIEHYEAIGNLASILDVEGLDATMIGPYDLSGSLGVPGDFENKKVKTAIGEYEKICKQLKKPMGFHVVQPDPRKTKELIARGYRFLPVGLDTIYLGVKCRETLRQIRGPQ